MYCIVRFNTKGDMMARAVMSPIYTSGAYPVRYLPYSIFNSGMHPIPVPAVIKGADSALLRPLGVYKSGKPARILDDRKKASLLPENIDSVSALSEMWIEQAPHAEMEELDEAIAAHSGNKVAEKHELPHGFDQNCEQGELQYGRLMRTSGRSASHSFAQDGMERESVREADTNTHQLVSKDSAILSHIDTLRGAAAGSHSIDQIHKPIDMQYFDIKQARLNELIECSHFNGRAASYSRYFAAAATKSDCTSVTQPDLVDRNAARDIESISLSSGKRLSSRGDKLSSISAGRRYVSNAVMQKRERGLERAAFRTDVKLAGGMSATKSSTGIDVIYVSIPFTRLHKRMDEFYSVVELSRLSINAIEQSDIISANTAINRGIKLDEMNSAQTESLTGKVLDVAHMNIATHGGAKLDEVLGTQTDALPADVSNSAAFARQSRGIKTSDIEQMDIAPDDTAVNKGTAFSEHVRLEMEHLCAPEGLFWDELWEELYRDYDNRVDRLQLPPVDFRYDVALLYDPKTGEPYKPLTPADVPEVMVEFPASHPVGKYADVGLKIVNVHLWVLKDVILLLYRDLKENTFSYEKLPPGEAVRIAIDRLYNKLRQFEYKQEEYQRAFRMVRWYGEYVIVSTNNYFLVREYEPWISHESSLDLENGIPKDDKPYVVRADGWEVDTTRRVYTTRAKDAVLELNVSNLLPTVFEFTVEIINTFGTASAKLTIDGRDKSYLLASLTRAEADLPKGEHSILFEFHTESENDRMELSGMKIDYVKFRSAQVVESPKSVNGREAVDMLIGMLKRYYDLHHEGKVKGTRLFNLGKRQRLGR